MDIYEKAKAYDDAIRKADDIRKGNCETPFVYSQGLFEYLFPLEESEDERIRKELLGFLRNIPNSNYTCEEMALWLEKQGEQKSVDKVEPFDKYEGLTDFERTLADIFIGWIGEEPGWKQYIKDNADVLLKTAIEKFNSVQVTLFEQKPAWSEEDIRNIQDIDSILFYDKDLPEETCMRLRNWLKSLKPHTEMVEALRTEYEKGRADTIAKMKSSWSEEDEKTLNEIFSVAARASLRKSTLFGKSYDYIKWQNWLKSLRDRVQPQPKQEWSEEDEHLSYWTIHNLTELKNRFGENYGDSGKCIDWIKQLKQRIGG